MVMVQINPLAAAEGPTQIKQQLSALEAALKSAAAAQGLALTSLAVQYHSGVSNAAPATAPFTPFGVLPPVNVPAAAAAAEGAADAATAAEGGVLGISDALCELQFRVSPTAFYQVRTGTEPPRCKGLWGEEVLVAQSCKHIVDPTGTCMCHP
jgi:hypothetical protein